MKAGIKHINGRIRKSSQDYLPASGTKSQKENIEGGGYMAIGQ